MRTACESWILGFGTCAKFSASLLLLLLFHLLHCVAEVLLSTQDHAAAAIARDNAAVFAWKGETLQEYWWYTERALDWGPGGGPDLIMDDGGDTTLLIHEGMKAEIAYAKDMTLPDPASMTNADFKIVLTILR